MNSFATDYSQTKNEVGHIDTSLDGFNSYLTIVDQVPYYIWVFFLVPNESQISLVEAFLNYLIHAENGDELIGSEKSQKEMNDHYNYTVEPTRADSQPQNGAAEIWNKTKAMIV